jgi:hypothetical protein
MVGNARREFAGLDGVSVVPGPNESLYVCVDGLNVGIDGTAICQFKKLDNDNRSRNLQTARQRKFRENEQVLGIPDTGSFVDAGYVMNDLGTVIRTVPLVRLVDQQLIFEVPEQRDGSISIAPPVGPMPLPGVADRFTILKRKKKKESSGNDGAGD